jgi:hypothetical protein
MRKVFSAVLGLVLLTSVLAAQSTKVEENFTFSTSVRVGSKVLEASDYLFKSDGKKMTISLVTKRTGGDSYLTKVAELPVTTKTLAAKSKNSQLVMPTGKDGVPQVQLFFVEGHTAFIIPEYRRRTTAAWRGAAASGCTARSAFDRSQNPVTASISPSALNRNTLVPFARSGRRARGPPSCERRALALPQIAVAFELHAGMKRCAADVRHQFARAVHGAELIPKTHTGHRNRAERARSRIGIRVRPGPNQRSTRSVACACVCSTPHSRTGTTDSASPDVLVARRRLGNSCASTTRAVRLRFKVIVTRDEPGAIGLPLAKPYVKTMRSPIVTSTTSPAPRCHRDAG